MLKAWCCKTPSAPQCPPFTSLMALIFLPSNRLGDLIEYATILSFVPLMGSLALAEQFTSQTAPKLMSISVQWFWVLFCACVTCLTSSCRLGDLIEDAIILSLVSYMGSIALAQQFASQERIEIDANQELIAFGITCIFASFNQV